MNYLSFAFVLFIGMTCNVSFEQQEADKSLIANIDKFLAEQFKPHEPGATVLISRRDEIIYHKAFGMSNLELQTPMQTDNVFWIASMGKQFTAVAILQLLEKGKLSLQDDITKYLPDYPTQGHHISIEHLLTHTSGIHNFSGMEDPEKKLAGNCSPEEVINFFKDLPMRFAPGTQWEYSNSGYFLLGYIIEKVTGNTYAAYLEENIFKPLEMDNTCYASDTRIIPNRVGSYSLGENGFENATGRNITHTFAAGSIQTTVEDLFKWHRGLYAYQLITKENLDRATSRYKLLDGTEVDYGYGWRMGFVYEHPTIWHGGSISGFGAVEMYLPDEDVFVAILSNCDCVYPKGPASVLASLASGRPYLFTEVDVDHSTFEEYTGVYEDAKGMQLILTVEGNKLFSQYGRGPKAYLKAYGKDRFFVSDDHSQTIDFQKNETGKVKELISGKLNGNQVWMKTNKALPDPDGINVEERILQTYVGEYEITHDFVFTMSKEHGKLYLQAPGDDKLEMLADTETIFFLKVNDARLEFVSDEAGIVTKVILSQGGKQTEAKKIR